MELGELTLLNSLGLGTWIGLPYIVGMDIKLAHISLPFFLIRCKSTQWSNPERSRKTYDVEYPAAQYVD
jgi:hypothetical protein